MDLSSTPDISEFRRDNRPRFLNEEQLFLLKKGINGSVLDTADGFVLKLIEESIEIVAGISPQFARHFAESLSQCPGDHGGKGLG